MSIQAVAWAIRQRVGSPTGKALLFCLANYADENGECWPSQTTISREAELSERATRDWLKALEAGGFIERRRRNRADGSRTSDLFRLCFEKRPEKPPSDLPAKSAGRPNQPATGSTPTGISRQSYRQEVPGNEPASEPSENPTSGADAHEADGFDQFWEAWPVDERPEKRPAAQRLFEALTAAERVVTADSALAYRRCAKGNGSIGLMIPYLRNRLWVEFADGPEVNSDGYFVVTPERPEWDAWIAAIRAEYGDWAVRSSIELGKILRRTRWPQAVATEQKADDRSLGGGPSERTALTRGHLPGSSGAAYV